MLLSDAAQMMTQTGTLQSLRPPAEGSPPQPGVGPWPLWRFVMPAAQGAGAENAREEYKVVCDFLRLYATLRFYRLALLLGTTGSIVTALAAQALRGSPTHSLLLRSSGLVITLAFLVMEFRATSHWRTLLVRANELARRLAFNVFPTSGRWNPLTTSGAGFYLHALVVLFWAISLVLARGLAR